MSKLCIVRFASIQVRQARCLAFFVTFFIGVTDLYVVGVAVGRGGVGVGVAWWRRR